MKKLILSLVFLLLVSLSFGQTATNFNVADCNGVNHDLFAELDAGNVVVLVWVMPCGSCIGSALSACTEVQNYASAYPNKIKYYVVDDHGNTSCNTLNTWLATNNINKVDAVFSNAAIDMTDYGTVGMPKVVVIGGSSHTIFFNENNGLNLNVPNFNAAIVSALNSSTGIEDGVNGELDLSLFPNPVFQDKAVLSYELQGNTAILIEIYNILGERVKIVSDEEQLVGKHEVNLDLSSLSQGVYKLTMRVNDDSKSLSFIID